MSGIGTLRINIFFFLVFFKWKFISFYRTKKIHPRNKEERVNLERRKRWKTFVYLFAATTFSITTFCTSCIIQIITAALLHHQQSYRELPPLLQSYMLPNYCSLCLCYSTEFKIKSSSLSVSALSTLTGFFMSSFSTSVTCFTLKTVLWIADLIWTVTI